MMMQVVNRMSALSTEEAVVSKQMTDFRRRAAQQRHAAEQELACIRGLFAGAGGRTGGVQEAGNVHGECSNGLGCIGDA